MTPLIAIPVLLLSQGHKLERVYKEGDVDRYKVSVTMNEEAGQAIDASGEIVATVAKLIDGGKAEIARKVEKLVFKVDGNVQEMPAADQRLDHFDKYGMPETMDVQGPQVLYVIQAFCGYTPHSSVAEGESFSIKWKANDDSVTITGKGTLAEVFEVDGVKSAKLKSTATVAPHNDSEGVVTWTSYISLVDGKLMKADGKVEIERSTVTFKVERIVKKD